MQLSFVVHGFSYLLDELVCADAVFLTVGRDAV
jgi:hypothetical protein